MYGEKNWKKFEYENKILKDKLKKAGISYEEVNPFEEKIESAEEYDLDQGNRIVNPPYITEKMAIRFFSMFWGREDAMLSLPSADCEDEFPPDLPSA